MRTINVNTITENIKDMCIQANHFLADDMDKAMKHALETEEAHEIMDVCIKAKKVLQKVMSTQAYNVGFNLGAAAGAGVAEHLHLHIVPRWNGDNNFMPVIGDIRVVPEALRDTAGLLRKEWK